MERSEENVAWAMVILGQLETLDYFPKTSNGLIGSANAFLDIIGDKEKGAWLRDKIAHSVTRYPNPWTMRKLYASGSFKGIGAFKPADGIEPQDLPEV